MSTWKCPEMWLGGPGLTQDAGASPKQLGITQLHHLRAPTQELLAVCPDGSCTAQRPPRPPPPSLEKLYGLGLVGSRRSLADCESLSAAAFCRRRLPCLLLKLRMAQNLRHAVTFVEQGHVRVGPEVVTDPALLIPRAVEDFITWVDASRLRQKVLDYNQERDDFDLAA
uniref:IMP U3 small nucleolar ribonucleoprotein 3 n=1 Tax=Athene cunicularia TaxID=194338 RepID=A0A663MLX1_ATHCN